MLHLTTEPNESLKLETRFPQNREMRLINFYPGPAPRGHTGAVPPQITACAPHKRNLYPPKRGLCPEEIKKLGATGVQIEAKDSEIR